MADTKDSKYTDPWCDPCAKDGKYATVDSYCPICVEFFCKDCIQFHATCERTKRHNVKHGIDMPSCQAEKPPKYEECPIHPGDLKEYFCIDHCTLICPECQNDHIRCLIKHATVMSKTLNNKDINSFEIEVTDAKKEITNAKYDVECKINSVEGNRKRMLKIVEEEYDKMKRIIAERFDNVAKEINNKSDEKVSSLTTLMKVFSDGKADYDSALNIIQTGARSKLDTKLFLKLQSSLDKIRHNNARLRQLEITKALKAADLEFYVDSRWTSLLSCYPKIGKVEKTMSLSPTALLGKTEFPPIEAEPFSEITVTADSLPPSDTFEMEGHDSYDSTENTVWKRGNDEAFIFCESGAGSEPRIVQNLEKMEPLEALVSPESTPDSKPKVIQTSERSEATIEAVQLSLPKQPATEDLMTKETAVGFMMM